MWCQASVFALGGSLTTGALVKNGASADYDSIGYWSGGCLFVAAMLQLIAFRYKKKHDREEKASQDSSTSSTPGQMEEA